MATIKSFTSLEQSKKLAEILPLESADMCYRYYSGGMITGYGDCVFAKSFITGKNIIRENDLPCWSLAALVDVFDNKAGLAKEDDSWFCYDNGKSYCTKHYINTIDACYEMILKLHELKML